MYFEKVRKTALSAFDEKRCYLNEIESMPWNCFSVFPAFCYCMKVCTCVDIYYV